MREKGKRQTKVLLFQKESLKIELIWFLLIAMDTAPDLNL